MKFTKNFEKSPKPESRQIVSSRRERCLSLKEQPKLPPVSCRTPVKKLNLEVDSIINIANQYKEDTELQTKIDLLVKNILDIKNVLKKKGRDVQSAPKGRSISLKK
jgi:hypothetical protein